MANKKIKKKEEKKDGKKKIMKEENIEVIKTDEVVIEETKKLMVDGLTYQNYIDAKWTDDQLLKDDRLKILVQDIMTKKQEIEKVKEIKKIKEPKKILGWTLIKCEIINKSKAFIVLKTIEYGLIRLYIKDYCKHGEHHYIKNSCNIRYINQIKKG